MLTNFEQIFNPINAKSDKFVHSVITTIAGCLAPIIILPLHILVAYYFWINQNRVINKNLCSCSCWDSSFKGPYESGIASYKHVYFNSTSNSFKMWSLTVLCILLLYEAIRRLVSLVLQRRVRFTMVILFASSVFSHYYSWWMFFNYWNDEYYLQWYHQLFFSLTEVLSSTLVLLLADRLVSFSPSRVLPVSAIATVHILISGYDQFFLNVLRGEEYSFQVVRDVCFMIPDLMHLVVPLYLLWGQHRTTNIKRMDYINFTSIVVIGLIIASFL